MDRTDRQTDWGCISVFVSFMQSLMLYLQSLPTSDWTDDDISVLLSEAFQLKYMFADAPSHLHSSDP